MAPQGATAKYFTTEIAHIVDILTVPFIYVNNLHIKHSVVTKYLTVAILLYHKQNERV